MASAPSTPPTTPPTIAPVCELLVETNARAVVDVVALVGVVDDADVLGATVEGTDVGTETNALEIVECPCPPLPRVTEGAVFNVEVEMMYVYKPELVSSGGSERLHKPMRKTRSEDETHEQRL